MRKYRKIYLKKNENIHAVKKRLISLIDCSRERRNAYCKPRALFLAPPHRTAPHRRQEWLSEPQATHHVKGGPFTVTVSPGEPFGRRSDAWGEALSGDGDGGGDGTVAAGVPVSLTVRARDVVGNAVSDGGAASVAVYAFHREAEVRL